MTIEPGRIAAARVSVDGSIRILDGGWAELDPGVVRDGEVAEPEALAQALRELWREHKELGKKLRIGIANPRIVVRTLLLPLITDAKELAAAVSLEAADAIPIPIADAMLDYHAAGTVETAEGPRQRIILVAARRDMIRNVLTAVRAAGLTPAAIDLSAFGMIRALERQPRESDSPELFVSVGGLTNLALAEHGACAFTRVAGGGLESLAVDLAARWELTSTQARSWIHRVGLEDDLNGIVGDAETAADARKVLTSGVRRIATDIRASLDFQQGRAQDVSAVQRVVLTGPAVAIAGFVPALEAELGLPVEARVVAGCDDLDVGLLDAGCLSVAAGLAVQGRTSDARAPRGRARRRRPGPEPRTMTVNLIPMDPPRGGAGFSLDDGLGAYVVVATLAVMVAMTGAWAISKSELAEQRTELTRVVAKAASAEARSAVLKPYSEFAVLRQARLDTVGDLLDGRFDWSRTLRDIGRVIPHDVSITSLVATASPEAKVAGGGSGQSLRGAAVGPAIDLVGCARTTAQVSDLLVALRAIDGVGQVSLASAEKSATSSHNDTDCRASDEMPQFSLTIAYEQAPPAAAAAPATALPTAAGVAGTTGARG